MNSRFRNVGIICSTLAFSLSLLASPAGATDLITDNAVGTYEYEYKGNKAIWQLQPCTDGARNCVEVSQYKLSDKSQTDPQWSSKAFWTVGSWIMVVDDTPKMVICKDESTYSRPVTYSWDAVKNKGYKAWHDPGLCKDSKASSPAFPFSLAKI